MAPKKEKSPFKGYSLEEVAYAEATTYVIQIGVDFFRHNGKATFTKKSAAEWYNKLHAGLVEAINHGTPKEKKHALACIVNFRVMPLRIH